MATSAMKLKRWLFLGRKAITNLDCILKNRHYFADKSPSSQSYVFSSTHVWMWELDHKEGWALKNWCFWPVVLEKTLESPLDCKEIPPIHSERDQPWDFFGRNDAKAENSNTLAIPSSVVPFSSCPQSLPALESFPMSHLFAWDGQSTGHNFPSKE